MTNFVACRSKRNRLNAIHASADTQSRASIRVVGQSVLSNHRLLQNANGQKIGANFNCGSSVYSGNSSSTLLSRASSTTSYQPNSSISNRSECSCSTSRQTDQTSVISSDFLIRSQKCGLCKEKIKFFREEFLCGHAFHGECIWRFKNLNPTYNSRQCPKNCMRRLLVKRTQSIESNSSRSSSSSSSSNSD